MFCLRDASQRARLLLIVLVVLLYLWVVFVLVFLYLWVVFVLVFALVFVWFVFVQAPGLLFPVCVLGWRDNCLVV